MEVQKAKVLNCPLLVWGDLNPAILAHSHMAPAWHPSIPSAVQTIDSMPRICVHSFLWFVRQRWSVTPKGTASETGPEFASALRHSGFCSSCIWTDASPPLPEVSGKQSTENWTINFVTLKSVWFSIQRCLRGVKNPPDVHIYSSALCFFHLHLRPQCSCCPDKWRCWINDRLWLFDSLHRWMHDAAVSKGQRSVCDSLSSLSSQEYEKESIWVTKTCGVTCLCDFHRERPTDSRWPEVCSKSPTSSMQIQIQTAFYRSPQGQFVYSFPVRTSYKPFHS